MFVCKWPVLGQGVIRLFYSHILPLKTEQNEAVGQRNPWWFEAILSTVERLLIFSLPCNSHDFFQTHLICSYTESSLVSFIMPVSNVSYQFNHFYCHKSPPHLGKVCSPFQCLLHELAHHQTRIIPIIIHVVYQCVSDFFCYRFFQDEV